MEKISIALTQHASAASETLTTLTNSIRVQSEKCKSIVFRFIQKLRKKKKPLRGLVK